MATTGNSIARLDFRLTPGTKSLIAQAAVLSGQSVSSFAVSTLAAEARKVISSHGMIELSNRDRDAFLAALSAELEPNERLRKAARRHERSVVG